MLFHPVLEAEGVSFPTLRLMRICDLWVEINEAPKISEAGVSTSSNPF